MAFRLHYIFAQHSRQRKFSAWASHSSFSFAITQEIIVIFFSLHLLRCFNSVGCSYLNWNNNRIYIKIIHFVCVIFKFINLFINQKNIFMCCVIYIQLNILIKK